MTAYQAVFLTPIIAVYVWLFARRSKAAWAVVLVPPIVIAGWQAFELLTVGKLPVTLRRGLGSSLPDRRVIFCRLRRRLRCWCRE